MNELYLAHHGIKGQKWGIRRFQNPDGTLTTAGKERRSEGTQKKNSISRNTLKEVGKVALVAGTVAGATYLYSRNSTAINSAVAKVASKSVDKLGSLPKKGANYMKSFAKSTYEGVKAGIKQAPQKFGEGIKEGLADAPKKVGKAMVEGAAIIAATKMLNATLGKDKTDQYIQAYNAYNKKNKIGRIDTGEKDDDDE